MVKQRKQLMAVPEANANCELTTKEDEDWIIVKKQKVTILVPPLVDMLTTPNVSPSQLQTLPTEKVIQSQHLAEPRPRKPLLDEQEKLTSLVPTRCDQIARKAPYKSNSTLCKAATPNRRYFKNPNESHASKLHSIVGIKTKNPSRPVQGIGINVMLDRNVLLHQRLKAINLERKLQKAGGLSEWLSSLGLGQFVRLFRGKNVNKFVLVNLTMDKLKDMGADAVGPRRKLMHAIECVCKPNCFEAS